MRRYSPREWRYVRRQRRLCTLLEWQPQRVLRQLCEDAEYIAVQPALRKYGDDGYTVHCRALARAVLRSSLFTLLPKLSNVSTRLVPVYIENYRRAPLEYAFVHNFGAFCTAAANFPAFFVEDEKMGRFFTVADDARRRCRAVSSIIDDVVYYVPQPPKST